MEIKLADNNRKTVKIMYGLSHKEEHCLWHRYVTIRHILHWLNMMGRRKVHRRLRVSCSSGSRGWPQRGWWRRWAGRPHTGSPKRRCPPAHFLTAPEALRSRPKHNMWFVWNSFIFLKTLTEKMVLLMCKIRIGSSVKIRNYFFLTNNSYKKKTNKILQLLK